MRQDGTTFKHIRTSYLKKKSLKKNPTTTSKTSTEYVFLQYMYLLAIDHNLYKSFISTKYPFHLKGSMLSKEKPGAPK